MFSGLFTYLLVGEVGAARAACAAGKLSDRIVDLADTTSPLGALIAAIEPVVLIVILYRVVRNFGQAFFDTLHCFVEMIFEGLSQRDDLLLVLEELLAQVEISVDVVLDVVQPLLFIPLVQLLQRRFKISLHEVKEHLLAFPLQVESNGVRETERSAGSHDQASDVD